MTELVVEALRTPEKMADLLRHMKPLHRRRESPHTRVFSSAADGILVKVHIDDDERPEANALDVETAIYQHIIPILYEHGGHSFVTTLGHAKYPAVPWFRAYPWPEVMPLFPRSGLRASHHLHLLFLTYSAGRPLYRFLQDTSPDLDLFYSIMLPLLLNLMVMDAAGLRHNDLHLGNILVERHEGPLNLRHAGIQIHFPRATLTLKIFDWDRATCGKTALIPRNLFLDLKTCREGYQCNDFLQVGTTLDVYTVCHLLCFEPSLARWGEVYLLPILKTQTNFVELVEQDRERLARRRDLRTFPWMISPELALQWKFRDSRLMVTARGLYERLVHRYRQVYPTYVLPPFDRPSAGLTLTWSDEKTIEDLVRAIPTTPPQEVWRRHISAPLLGSETGVLTELRWDEQAYLARFWEELYLRQTPPYWWAAEAADVTRYLLQPFFGPEADPVWVSCLGRLVTCPLLSTFPTYRQFWYVVSELVVCNDMKQLALVLQRVAPILPWNQCRPWSAGSLAVFHGPYVTPQGRFEVPFRTGMHLV